MLLVHAADDDSWLVAVVIAGQFLLFALMLPVANVVKGIYDAFLIAG